MAVCLGRWRLPLPEWLAFRVDGRSSPSAPDEARVDVRVSLPGGRLLFAYRGVMRFPARGSGAPDEVASDA
jgi:hypothetical protein